MKTKSVESVPSHTPGSWHVEKQHGRYEIWPKDIGQAHSFVGVVQRDLDARLIAAAPELLNACHALEQAVHLWFTEGSRASGQLRDLRKLLVDDTMKQTRAAIAKATGGNSAPSAPHKVVVEVLGGVAEVTTCPPGVDVQIIDHDNEKVSC